MITTIELNKNKAWYRFPLVWMMLAIPFSAVIMGVVMIWLAVDTDDGLVADDYYKQGLAINRVLSRDKKAAELNLSAIIKFDSDTKVINLQFDKGTLESFPQGLQLHLQHATRENSDVMVWLDHGIDDQYIGHVKQAISEGVWYFEISDKGKADAGWKLNARTHVRSNNIIHLQSDY
jgi:hypothetical protein